MIQAILLAGGKGTRLSPLTDNLPKPLVRIHGKPMMQYVLEHLRSAGIIEVAISVAHLGQMIVDEFGDGSSMGMKFTYLIEPTPMGTAGWTKLVDWNALDENFLVVNADNLFWIDVLAFIKRHADAGGIATIAGTELPSAEIINYEILRANDQRDRLEAYVDRSKSIDELADKTHGFINTGWYVMNKSVQNFIDDVVPISNEVHLWPRLSASQEIIGFYHATEPWFDSGTHERLGRVSNFILSLK